MHTHMRAMVTIAGWSLLAACNPDKGQQTGDAASDAASSSGTTEAATGGSSGAAVTTTSSSTSTGAPVTTSGPDPSSTDDTADSMPGGSGTSGSFTTTATTATTADETTTDTGTGTTGASSTTGGAMLIECNGCTCDPAVSYCQVTWSPTMDPPPEHPSGQCPFIEAGVYDYGCVAYPPECGQDPSCDCVPKTDPICGCMDGGGWMVVNCDYP